MASVIVGGCGWAVARMLLVLGVKDSSNSNSRDEMFSENGIVVVLLWGFIFIGGDISIREHTVAGFSLSFARCFARFCFLQRNAIEDDKCCTDGISFSFELSM